MYYAWPASCAGETLSWSSTLRVVEFLLMVLGSLIYHRLVPI
jgi:hypothetical protein